MSNKCIATTRLTVYTAEVHIWIHTYVTSINMKTNSSMTWLSPPIAISSEMFIMLQMYNTLAGMKYRTLQITCHKPSVQ